MRRPGPAIPKIPPAAEERVVLAAGATAIRAAAQGDPEHMRAVSKRIASAAGDAELAPRPAWLLIGLARELERVAAWIEAEIQRDRGRETAVEERGV